MQSAPDGGYGVHDGVTGFWQDSIENPVLLNVGNPVRVERTTLLPDGGWPLDVWMNSGDHYVGRNFFFLEVGSRARLKTQLANNFTRAGNLGSYCVDIPKSDWALVLDINGSGSLCPTCTQAVWDAAQIGSGDPDDITGDPCCSLNEQDCSNVVVVNPPPPPPPPPPATCDAVTITAAAVCAGRSYSETLPCDDGTTITNSGTGSKLWSAPSGLNCAPFPGIACTTNAVCAGDSIAAGSYARTCSDADGSHRVPLDVTAIGTGPLVCGPVCTPWMPNVTPPDVCVMASLPQTRTCDDGLTTSTETRDFVGTRIGDIRIAWGRDENGVLRTSHTDGTSLSTHVVGCTNMSGTPDDVSCTIPVACFDGEMMMSCTDAPSTGRTNSFNNKRFPWVGGQSTCGTGVTCPDFMVTDADVCPRLTTPYTEMVTCSDATTTVDNPVYGARPLTNPPGSTNCSGPWWNRICDDANVCSGSADTPVDVSCTDAASIGGGAHTYTVTVQGVKTCLTCDPETITSADVCAGASYTETRACSDGTTIDNVVTGSRPWQAPTGTTCSGSWPSVNCSSGSVCDGSTESQQQTCTNNIAGATPTQRPITVAGTDTSCPPAAVCPPFTVSAGDICAGETYTETTANCDDNSVNSQTLVGTRPWDPINGVTCPPYPGTQCTSDSVCLGQTTRPRQNCSEPATGRGPFSRELQLTGTGTTGSCNSCPAWTTAPAAVCAGLSFTETRNCNGASETRTITGTMTWNEPDGGSICSGQTGTETRSCLDTQLHEELVSNVAGTLNCACDPADISWSPDRNSVCAGRNFTQTGTCPGNPSQTRSRSGSKRASVTWTGPQGYYYSASSAPPANLICDGITLNASASCSDSYGSTAGALPTPASVDGTKGASSYTWRSRYNSAEWNSKPPAAQVCAGVVFDRVGICSDTVGRVDVEVATSSTPVTGTRAASNVDWTCDDGSSPSSPSAATVCQGVSCSATATCSDSWGTSYRPATAPANVTGTKTTGTCASGCTPHTWTGPGGATRGSAPSASTVCVGDFWTGVNDCGVSLGTVNGTKTTGSCATACSPVTQTWTTTTSGYSDQSSLPTASSYCPRVTWTGTQSCPGEPDVSLGTVTGTRSSGETWVQGSNTRTSRPAASTVCTGVAWTGSNDCGSLGTVHGSRGCVCTPVTQSWTTTSAGFNDRSNKPTAIYYCPSVTWIGTESCPGDPDVALGTVTGTKASAWSWSWPSGVSGSGRPSVTTRAQQCATKSWTSTDTACSAAGETLRGTKTGYPCCTPNWVWTWPSGVAGSGEPSAATRAQHCPSAVWTSTDSTTCVSTGDTLKGTKAAKLTWTRRSDGLVRGYADGVIVAADVCKGDRWDVVAACQSTPNAVVGAKDTNRAAWTCTGNGSSDTLPMAWYTSLNSPPRAADVCKGVTCAASSWECQQPSSYFSSSSLTKPRDVVGTKTTPPCSTCSLSFTDPGEVCVGSTKRETKTCASGTYLSGGTTSETRNIVGTKTTGSCATCSLSFTDPGEICVRTTETETKTCPPGTFLSGGATSETRSIAGTKAERHRWSSPGLSDLTTTPVAANYCPTVLWTDTPTCTTKSSDIRGTKTTGTCCVVNSSTETLDLFWSSPPKSKLPNRLATVSV